MENGLGLLIVYTLQDIGNCRIHTKHSKGVQKPRILLWKI